jgi:hypothetical protein
MQEDENDLWQPLESLGGEWSSCVALLHQMMDKLPWEQMQREAGQIEATIAGRAQTEAAEARTRPAATAAAMALLRGGEPPDMTPEERYFLAERLDVLDAFLCQMTAETEPGSGICVTIVPFPEADPETVLEWFLTEWWIGRGRDRLIEIWS